MFFFFVKLYNNILFLFFVSVCFFSLCHKVNKCLSLVFCGFALTMYEYIMRILQICKSVCLYIYIYVLYIEYIYKL